MKLTFGLDLDSELKTLVFTQSQMGLVLDSTAVVSNADILINIVIYEYTVLIIIRRTTTRINV